MGQITGKYDFLSRVNLRDLATLPTPAAGEYILVSSDNSMNAAGQGNFDCYIVGNGTKAAAELELKSIDNDLFKQDGMSTTEVAAQLGGYKMPAYSITGYIKSDGSISSTPNSCRTDYVDCAGFKNIQVTANLDSSGCIAMFYDANKSALPDYKVTGSGNKTYNIDIPSAAKYVILSHYNTSVAHSARIYTANNIVDNINDLQDISNELSNEVGASNTYLFTLSDKYGYYWNGSTFVNSGSSVYNGYYLPLKEGAEYNLQKHVTGVLTKVVCSGSITTGFYQLSRSIQDETFVAQAGEDFLYVTINTSSVASTYSITEDYGTIAPNVAFLEGKFGKTILKGKKALVFGDSITCTNTIDSSGNLSLRKLNWTSFAMEELQMDYYNYAQDGGRWTDDSDLSTYQKVSEQINLAISKHDSADVIILSLGTNNWDTNNDTLSDALAVTNINSLDRTKIHQAIRWALWTLRTTYPTARFFVALPLQRADHIQKGAIFDAIEPLAKIYGCYIFDQFKEVGICSVNEVWNNSGLYLADGLHPNYAGKKLQANYMVKKLLEDYI